MLERYRDFRRAGHLPTLLTAFLYFDFTFAIWVLNGALAPFIALEFGLDPEQKGFMVAVPIIAGALMRFPLGILSQYIGRKNAAMLEMSIITVCLLFGFFVVSSYHHVLGMGIALGAAGASFGVALSLGSGSYPPKYKGLAMGIAGAGNSGTVLAMLFAPPLAMRYGWKAVYGIAAIPMLTALLLLLIFAKEPTDQQHQEKKSLGEYLKILFNRDVWVFNIIYAVTFGGFIGLSSFLPIFFFDHYHIPKQSVGQYAAVVVMMASMLRVVGGWLADKVGGLRLLYGLSATILVTLTLAATLPANPWVMVAILAVTFSAMGAGNGALFQLVPLRFKASTTVASSFIGEVGALAGGALPVIMGISKQRTGSFAPGFMTGVILSLTVLTLLILMTRAWTSSWVGAGGKALPDSN